MPCDNSPHAENGLRSTITTIERTIMQRREFLRTGLLLGASGLLPEINLAITESALPIRKER